jgi:MHS family proline/betaine transporter-like MFS transporter
LTIKRQSSPAPGFAVVLRKQSHKLPPIRCTAIALGFNVTTGIAGGLTPLVATWLVERTANDYSPAFMIMVAAAVSFLALLSFKETFRAQLA